MRFKIRQSEKRENLNSIDMIRGFACLMVVFYHFAIGYDKYLPYDNVLRGFGSWFWTAVEIFFVISGFVIPYAMYYQGFRFKDYGIFMKKRIIRIEPPFIASIILVLILNYISTLSPYYRGLPYSIDWTAIALHLGYLNIFTGGNWVNPVYWTLALEFQYYILIGLVFVFLVSNRQLVRIGMCMALLAMTFIPYSKSIFPFMPYFVIGISFFQYFVRISTSFELALVNIAACAILYVNYGPVLVCISLATALMIVQMKKTPRWLCKVGDISFSLYLVHVPVGGRIVNITDALVQNETVRSIVVFVAMAVSIFVAYFFYTYIEVYFRNLSSKIRYRKKQVVEPKVEPIPVLEPVVTPGT